MNEDLEENIKYHSATIKEAIISLGDKKLIKEINDLVRGKKCRIYICHSRDTNKNRELHFIAMLGLNDEINDQILPDFDSAEISAFIKDSIDYDFVTVDSKGEYTKANFERLFEDVTSFTPENYDNILTFLKRYYSQCYQDVSTVHQDKRQRSVSSPPTSFFAQNGNHQQNAGNLPTPEIVAEYLQKAPWWPALSTSPENAGDVIDKGCGIAKRTLSEKQSSDLRPTGAAK